MPSTPRHARRPQTRPTRHRRALIVALAVVLAAAAGNLSPHEASGPHAAEWNATAGLLAAGGTGSGSGGSISASGAGGGLIGSSPTGGSTGTGAAGDGSDAAAPAGASSGGRSDTAVLSRVAAGLVDVDTLTDNARLLGTGMVLRSDGLVLTNHHVIDHATQIRVRDLGDHRVYRATVAAVNTTHDLALLRLQGAANLSVVTFGDSRTVTIGDPITALGNAGGGNANPIAAAGTVTALNQAVDAHSDDGTTEHLAGMVQGNAPAAPGDSGGPMLNSAGVIIGVTTAGSDNSERARGRASPTGGATPPTVVDATPINFARAWISQVTA